MTMIEELKEHIYGYDQQGKPAVAGPPTLEDVINKVNEIIRYLNEREGNHFRESTKMIDEPVRSEEAAEEYASKTLCDPNDGPSTGLAKESFIAGAKWQKEQKSAEWSEEDEEILKLLILNIGRYKYFGGMSSERILAFLKSLRPQYHGDVTMTEAYKMGKEAGEAPSWKPSEEQMEALLNAEGFLRAGLQHDSAKTIAELYEQLKKL